MSGCSDKKISINYQPTVSASEHHQFPIMTCHRAVNQDKLLQEITCPTQNTSHIQFHSIAWSSSLLLSVAVTGNRNCITRIEIHSVLFVRNNPMAHSQMGVLHFRATRGKHNPKCEKQPVLRDSRQPSPPPPDRMWHLPDRKILKRGGACLTDIKSCH